MDVSATTSPAPTAAESDSADPRITKPDARTTVEESPQNDSCQLTPAQRALRDKRNFDKWLAENAAQINAEYNAEVERTWAQKMLEYPVLLRQRAEACTAKQLWALKCDVREWVLEEESDICEKLTFPEMGYTTRAWPGLRH